VVNCEQVRGLTGALLEGESHPEAFAHLAACPRCRLLVEDLAAVERAARSLPVLQPRPQLWNRIRAAAVAEGLWGQPVWTHGAWGFFPLRPAFAAVLVLTLVAAASLVGFPSLTTPVAETAPATAFEVAQGELIHEASYGARYRIHLKNVENRVLGEETTAMDAELRDLTARPLGAVDRAIEQTQRRLATYPDDAMARDELLRLYRQKATVLQAMGDPVWLDAGQ